MNPFSVRLLQSVLAVAPPMNHEVFHINDQRLIIKTLANSFETD